MIDRFPEDFLWGAATSAHQVEGDNFFNDWWEWEQAGNTEPSGKACDHYNRFKEDFSVAKDLGHNAHRFGLEWSRLEKEEGTWDRQEWDHYKAVVEELRKLGIEPVVTLNHFTLPLWLARKGGWKNSEAVELFARFAVKAIEELGDRVQYWIPINEPYIFALIAYYKGEWPPCEKNLASALLVIKHLIRAHVEAYRRMHGTADASSSIMTPKVGAAKAVAAFHPCSPDSMLDRLMAYLRDRFHNHSFIRSVLKGKMDLLPFRGGMKLPVSKAADFIGINYYSRQFIHHERPFSKHLIGEVCSYEHHKNTGELSDMGWEIYPEGLYDLVKSFSRYRVPIMITENGVSTRDDTLRKRFIKDHLGQLLRAMNEGAPVIGYLHWSLIDNFEWTHGYAQKFGLVEVDLKTQERKIRDSARYLASIMRTGKIQ